MVRVYKQYSQKKIARDFLTLSYYSWQIIINMEKLSLYMNLVAHHARGNPGFLRVGKAVL